MFSYYFGQFSQKKELPGHVSRELACSVNMWLLHREQSQTRAAPGRALWVSSDIQVMITCLFILICLARGKLRP